MLIRTAIAILLLGSVARADAPDPDDDNYACACDVTPAACDAGCACDDECTVDWSADECSDPAAGCLPAQPDDEATVEADETAPSDGADDTPDWTVATASVTCPTGATLAADGTCAPNPNMPVEGGCAVGGGGILLALGIALAIKKRKAALAVVFASCVADVTPWDGAVDLGPDGGDYHDVYAAQLGDSDSIQILLANQALVATAHTPAAQFSLTDAASGVPLYRTHTACGDRLATSGGDELLGWAAAQPEDATADLVELTAPDGCAHAYETDPDTIADMLALGFTRGDTVAQVWPPGWSDAAPSDDDGLSIAPATPAPCVLKAHPALELLYASPGKVETLRFLMGCPGEVVVGEKRETGPIGAMKSAEAHAAGGRTAFVLDRNGDKLRELLMRSNGVERTVAYLKHKLAIGYDYIVIDEITAAPDWADGQTLNHRLRQLLVRMPARKIIPYISIDLTSYPPGFGQMRDRRLLLRAFKVRGRALALEVYLHTGQVMAGSAPSAFRRAADRLALAVHGLAKSGGINGRAITTIGLSRHSGYAQYDYLDEPAHDLAAIKREVNAIRNGGSRLRQQHGVGWYFVNKSDLAPPHNYTYDALIGRMRTQALRFR